MTREIILLIIGAVIGAFFSWLPTKIYYEKGKKDSDKLVVKLTSCISAKER